MVVSEVEKILCESLSSNAELSGDGPLRVTSKTSPIPDISGFDSLRMIEVIIDVEQKIDCELPPEKVFGNTGIDGMPVSHMAKLICEYELESNK